MTNRKALEVLSNLTAGDHWQLRGLAHTVLEILIERDEAGKVKKSYLLSDPPVKRHTCPSCNKNVDIPGKKPRFCYTCGQRLKGF